MLGLEKSSGKYQLFLVMATCGVVALFGLSFAMRQVGAQPADTNLNERLLSVYDGNVERGLLTQASTLREALREAGITIDPNDSVEPSLDEKLEANNYEVNIYRARPITIIDGQTRIKVMSPHRTAQQVADQAGIKLHDEDIAEMRPSTDVAGQGVGVYLSVTRATEFTLMLYGKKTTAYTQATTVKEMLREKGITLEKDDTLSVSSGSRITSGMTIEIWRDGIQTITEEQAIPYDVQRILDMDHKIGYHEVKKPGQLGTRLVTYAIEAQDGKETGRQQIQSIVGKEPIRQIEIIGNQPVNGLSKVKGAQHFIDSRGVKHRETYYDLPMGGTAGRCGGGTYTIRADGAKIDRDGYILIAANLGRYPYCSVVETSLGLGKVYDTGGFAAVHPDGFDLATDWTNYDGR
jgi:uncharacterized protein YabE (DUF348 family)